MHRTRLDFSLCSGIKYRPNINKTCFKSYKFSPCLIIERKFVHLYQNIENKANYDYVLMAIFPRIG